MHERVLETVQHSETLAILSGQEFADGKSLSAGAEPIRQRHSFCKQPKNEHDSADRRKRY